MPSAHEIQKTVCRRCYAVLDVGDNYCRRCGAPTSPSVAAASPRAAYGGRPKWSETRGGILVSLFALLGPLALPMLWRSRQFSRPWKIVLTALVVAITVVVVWLLWYVIHKALEPLGQLRELGF